MAIEEILRNLSWQDREIVRAFVDKLNREDAIKESAFSSMWEKVSRPDNAAERSKCFGWFCTGYDYAQKAQEEKADAQLAA